MKLFLEKWPSPLCPLFLVTDQEDVLRALEFEDREDRLHRLLRLHYGNYELEDRPAPAALKKTLTAYFQGDLAALDSIRTVTGGTPFQRETWQALRAIPAGTTVTYGGLAAQIGHAAAIRAVGAANGANPIGIVVPCHRVIGANGSLTGYAGGLARKQWLLDHERTHSPALA